MIIKHNNALLPDVLHDFAPFLVDIPSHLPQIQQKEVVAWFANEGSLFFGHWLVSLLFHPIQQIWRVNCYMCFFIPRPLVIKHPFHEIQPDLLRQFFAILGNFSQICNVSSFRYVGPNTKRHINRELPEIFIYIYMVVSCWSKIPLSGNGHSARINLIFVLTTLLSLPSGKRLHSYWKWPWK